MIKSKYIKDTDAVAKAPWYLSFFIKMEKRINVTTPNCKNDYYDSKKINLTLFTKSKYLVNSIFKISLSSEDIEEYIVNLKTNLISITFKESSDVIFLTKDLVENGIPEKMILDIVDNPTPDYPFPRPFSQELTDVEFFLNDDGNLTLNFIL